MQQPGIELAKKFIKYANILLFKFPYQLEKWDPPLKNCLNQRKSRCLIPFKWLITEKRAENRFTFDSLDL